MSWYSVAGVAVIVSAVCLGRSSRGLSGFGELRKSRGHIAFSRDGQIEFYEQNGEVYRAPIHNAFDVDSYRHGRWESSRKHFDRHRAQFDLAGFGAEEDPRRLHARSSRNDVQRRYLAKKFWGSSVLAAQSAQSMALLSKRTNWYSKDAAREARELADKMSAVSSEADALAKKYDDAWAQQRARERTRYSGNVETPAEAAARANA